MRKFTLLLFYKSTLVFYETFKYIVNNCCFFLDCTGVFYNFNLAGKADAQAQAYAIAATDAITTADAVASAQVKAAAAAIVEVKVRAKAASKAASLCEYTFSYLAK